jgi:microcompartment protein CcmK/EutM
MLLGKVVGTLVATRKDEKLEGLKFLVLQRLDINGQPMDSYVVAVDAVGAGLDEVVMYATGSSARQTVLTDRRPCDAAIMAIVDTWEVGGNVKYQKV